MVIDLLIAAPSLGIDRGSIFVVNREHILIVREIVSDGLKLLTKVQSAHPNIVLLDVTMPGVRGLMTVAVLRKTFPTTRLVLLVGREPDSLLSHVLNLGVYGIIFREAPFFDVIRALIIAAQGGFYMTTMEVGSLDPQLVPIKRERRPVVTRRCSNLIIDCRRDELTPREHEILTALSGRTNAEIAAYLGVSVNTVKTMLKRLFEKFNVQSRSECVAVGKALGLVSSLLEYPAN